jgi:hypothetical protein
MLANAARETTATTGTGTVTLAAVTGYPRFAQVLGVGKFVDYAIKSGENWEWGIGRLAAGNTLERSAVTAKFEGGTYTKTPTTKLALAGTSEVFCTIHSETNGIGAGGGSLDRTAAVVLSAHMVKLSANPDNSGYTPFAANRLMWFPFVWPAGVDRYATGVRLSLFSASGTKMRIAIVEPGDPVTTSRIVAQTGDIPTNTSGIKTATFAAPVPLPLARYYLGVLCDGTPNILAAHAGLMDPYVLQFGGNLFPRGGASNNVAAGWTSITDAMVRAGVDNGEDRAQTDPMIAMVQA